MKEAEGKQEERPYPIKQNLKQILEEEHGLKEWNALTDSKTSNKDFEERVSKRLRKERFIQLWNEMPDPSERETRDYNTAAHQMLNKMFRLTYPWTSTARIRIEPNEIKQLKREMLKEGIIRGRDIWSTGPYELLGLREYEKLGKLPRYTGMWKAIAATLPKPNIQKRAPRKKN